MTRLFSRLTLITGLLTLLVPGARADNWPRFRGPNGTGVAADKGIPVEWDEKSVLWKTAIPGVGNSSPVVWGDRLFIQSATEKERSLLCLSVTDGKVLWTVTVPGAKGHTHDKNTLASSTPATDGKRVYVLFWDGKDIALHAYDFKGKDVWTRGLGGFKSQHGPGQSPIVVDDKVIFANDQDESSVLIALDAKTGKPAWQAERKHFRSCYSTPFLLERKGGATELVVASTAGLTGYDPATGGQNWAWTWKFDGMALRTVASPIYTKGLVLASSGDGSGARHMVAVKPGQPGGDNAKSALAWQNKSDFPYVPCLLAKGDHVYYVNDTGLAGCHQLKNGASVWKKRLNAGFTASPVLIDGKIYAVSEDGDVYVLAASTTFKQLAKNSLGESVSASPAVADNRLFIRGKEHLFCIVKPSAK
jgi:outer membrane protein assembly factor BamB